MLEPGSGFRQSRSALSSWVQRACRCDAGGLQHIVVDLPAPPEQEQPSVGPHYCDVPHTSRPETSAHCCKQRSRHAGPGLGLCHSRWSAPGRRCRRAGLGSSCTSCGDQPPRAQVPGAQCSHMVARRGRPLRRRSSGRVRNLRRFLPPSGDGEGPPRTGGRSAQKFIIDGNGIAYFTAYRHYSADLASAGGPQKGTALDATIQGVDLSTGALVFDSHARTTSRSTSPKRSTRRAPPTTRCTSNPSTSPLTASCCSRPAIPGASTRSILQRERSSGDWEAKRAISIWDRASVRVAARCPHARRRHDLLV